MIQRVQSLFLFLATIINLVILFYAPLFIHVEIFTEVEIITMKDLQNSFPLLLLLISTFLSLFSIFQFRNRLRQLMIVNISRLFLAVCFLFLIIFKEEGHQFYYGSFLLITPYIILLLSSYLIKRDEKLVRSADRIR